MAWDAGDYFMLGLFVGVIVIGFVIALAHVGDDNDNVDTGLFGERLCESQGLVYDRRELTPGRWGQVPVIYCKENTTESVYDGVVVFEGGREQ